MSSQPIDQPPVGSDGYYAPEAEGPGLIDGLCFLYRRRIKFSLIALIFFGLGLFAFLYSHFSSPKKVSATVELQFAGIEKQEYPSGAKFSVEDFRSPEVLTRAITDAGLAGGIIKPSDLAAHLSVTPVVPGDVQSRWKKQEANGAKKEEYFPSEFNLEFDLGGLTDNQGARLFDAIIARYRESVKHNQELALGFMSTWDTSYEKLANMYDFWDLPELFGGFYGVLNKRINAAIAESLRDPDPKFQLAFRNMARELSTWHATRFITLEATTYQGKLVNDKDLKIQQVQYRVEDLDIQIREKSQEATDATRLLGVIDQPRPVLAGQLSNKEGMLLIDAGTIDRLIKSDYVGPVVQHISTLQEEIHKLEADKALLQKQLSWLPKSSNVTISQIPASQKNLINMMSSELKEITQNYNRLLDEYISSTITSNVLVAGGPVVSREGSSLVIALLMVVLLSLFLSVFYLAVEHLIRRARVQEKELKTAERQYTAAGTR